MKHAFLFDMDGVIVNSEQIWDEYGKDFEQNVFGKNILEKVGDTTGVTLQRLHALATEYGFDRNLADITKLYVGFMESIYDKTTVAPGFYELVHPSAASLLLSAMPSL